MWLEGIAREFVNRIQNLRKELGFDVTDRIKIEYQGDEEIIKSASLHHDYICNEVLANQFVHNEEITSNEVDVYEKNVFLHLTKV